MEFTAVTDVLVSSSGLLEEISLTVASVQIEITN